MMSMFQGKWVCREVPVPSSHEVNSDELRPRNPRRLPFFRGSKNADYNQRTSLPLGPTCTEASFVQQVQPAAWLRPPRRAYPLVSSLSQRITSLALDCMVAEAGRIHRGDPIPEEREGLLRGRVVLFTAATAYGAWYLRNSRGSNKSNKNW